MLSSDLGDIKWDAVPLQQVERVEVVKGAGSALYGTGALGGVINVLTRDPARGAGHPLAAAQRAVHPAGAPPVALAGLPDALGRV